MHFGHSKKLKYMALLPLLFLVLNAFFFYQATKAINTALLEEKFDEGKTNVDILAGSIDTFINDYDDWGIYNYESMVTDLVDYVNLSPGTLALAYVETDAGLMQIASPSKENIDFDPLSYTEFNSAVLSNDYGDITLPLLPESGLEGEMWVYYRWIPSDNSLKGRFLLVTAVSRHTVLVPVAAWISTGQWISMGVTFLLEIWLVIAIVYVNIMRDKLKSGVKGSG